MATKKTNSFPQSQQISSKNQSSRAAAQTASIGQKDMMTFLPDSKQEGAAPTTGTTGIGVPDPLLRPSLFHAPSADMDDDAFNASLDALLKEACDSCGGGEVSDSLSGQSLAGLLGPLPPPLAGTGENTPLVPAPGPRRRRPGGVQRRDAAVGPPPASPGPGGGAPAPQQPPPQQQQLLQALNYSARGIIQLPPMFTPSIAAGAAAAASSQPIAVAAAGPVPGTLDLLGGDFLAALATTPGGTIAPAAAMESVGRGSALPRSPGPVPPTGGGPLRPPPPALAPPQPFQVAAPAALSTGMGSLISIIGLQPSAAEGPQAPPGQSQTPQAQAPQAPVPPQAPSQTAELFPAFQASNAFAGVLAPLRAPGILPSLRPAARTSTAGISAVGNPTAGTPTAGTPATMTPVAETPTGEVESRTHPSALKVPPAGEGHSRPPLRRRRGSATAATGRGGVTAPRHPPVSEDESERLKRRADRNRREQERSQRITSRIAELRAVLSRAGVSFKPDRYSTLVRVTEYVQELQGENARLDEEHRRLLATIAGADRLVQARVGGATSVQSHDLFVGATEATSSATHSNTDEEFLTFVRGIDYRSVFAGCGAALAIAAVDGRFVDCNEEFLRITDYSRAELLGERLNAVPRGRTAPVVSAAAIPDAPASGGVPAEINTRPRHHLSLFNLLGGEDMETVYAAMSRMLRATGLSVAVGTSGGARRVVSGRAVPASGADDSGSADDSGGTSASSRVESDLTRSTGDASSQSGNEVAAHEGPRGSAGMEVEGGSGDYWTGRVKYTRRREDQRLQLNISLVRTNNGRPKFFNCSLAKVE